MLNRVILICEDASKEVKARRKQFIEWSLVTIGFEIEVPEYDAESGELSLEVYPPSHIYCFNARFSKESNNGIAIKLNKTSYKLLTWCLSPKKTLEIGLKDVLLLK